MLIEERTADDAELSALLSAAFAELVRRYGAEGRSPVHAQARYLVACVGGAAVGCGAVQPLDPGIGELKRMFVLAGSRGQGIARKLVAALEELARDMGCHTLRLGTGVRQPEAIALYERCGYVRIEPYGKYGDEPLMRCYQKALSAGPERSISPLPQTSGR